MRLILALLLVALLPASALAGFGAATSADANAAGAAAVFAPRSATPPSVDGAPVEGTRLSAGVGTWERQPETFEVEWLRCAEDCITVATGERYEVAAADVDKRLRVRITARNAGGEAVATSAPTGVVTPAPQVEAGPRPELVAAPAVAGVAQVDDQLTALPGQWHHAPTSFAYRWLRCTGTACVPIAGETGSRYRTDGDDADATLKVEVTAANASGTTVATSPATAPIARRAYTQILCANPSTGQGVIGDGMVPDGITGSTEQTEFTQITLRSRCGGTMTIDRGVPLRPRTRISTTGWAQGGVSLRYRAPLDVVFQGAKVYRRITLAGATNLIAGVNGANSDAIYGTPAWDRCEMAAGCTTGKGQSATSPWGAPVNVGTSPTINGFNMFTRCGAPDHSWLCAADTHHGLMFHGALVALRDPASPRVTSGTGSLATSDVLDGVEPLRLAATDEGSGLYRVRVLLDDAEVAAQVVGQSTGRCVDPEPGDDDPYEFATMSPCAKSVDTTLSFDTAAWPRGPHRLRLLLEDAGRNTVTLSSRNVVVGCGEADC